MLNQSENVIIRVNDADVVVPADYLSYTYLVEDENTSTMGFFQLLSRYPWAVPLLNGKQIVQGQVTISIVRPDYDVWAYQKGL